MDQTSIQAIINRGSGLAASILGSNCQVYRPGRIGLQADSTIIDADSTVYDASSGVVGLTADSTATDADSAIADASGGFAGIVVPENQIATLKVYFDSKPDFLGRAPNLYAHPVWAALCDRSILMIGDVLVAPEITAFVATLQPLLPTAVVECNTTCTISRPGDGAAPQRGYLSGSVPRTLASNWPASVLQGAKGEADKTGAVGSPRQPWATILLPAIDGVLLLTGDQIVDGWGRRWSLSSVEITDLGYRLTAAFEGA